MLIGGSFGESSGLGDCCLLYDCGGSWAFMALCYICCRAILCRYEFFVSVEERVTGTLSNRCSQSTLYKSTVTLREGGKGGRGGSESIEREKWILGMDWVIVESSKHTDDIMAAHGGFGPGDGVSRTLFNSNTWTLTQAERRGMERKRAGMEEHGLCTAQR